MEDKDTGKTTEGKNAKREVPITADGERELNRFTEHIATLTKAEAWVIAESAKRTQIDRVDIEKAAARIRALRGSSGVTWCIRFAIAVLFAFAIHQFTIMPLEEIIKTSPITQFRLLLLPIMTIVWVFILSYELRDFWT